MNFSNFRDLFRCFFVKEQGPFPVAHDSFVTGSRLFRGVFSFNSMALRHASERFAWPIASWRRSIRDLSEVSMLRFATSHETRTTRWLLKWDEKIVLPQGKPAKQLGNYQKTIFSAFCCWCIIVSWSFAQCSSRLQVPEKTKVKRLYGQHSDRIGLPSMVTGNPGRTASAVARTCLVASFV